MEKQYSSKKTPPKTTALSTRAMAAKVILQVLDEGKSLSTLIPEAQSSVKAQDFPLVARNLFRCMSRIASFGTNHQTPCG